VLDKSPKEPEWLSWFYVVAGVLVIFFTIPFARAFRKIISENIGSDFFLYITATIALVVGILALRNLKSRKLPLNARLSLFAIIAAFLAYIYSLRDMPEEAIHIAEYGMVSVLIYRALVHRIHDFSIYLLATLAVGVIGVFDEYLQWITPSRVFDLRDMRTNIISGGLAQLFIAAGLRPRIISAMPQAKSWSRLSYFLATGIFILALGFINTPQRIAWYAGKIPALQFLMDNDSMMVEYGYRYDDPEIGIFRSRFSPQQLKEIDPQRGTEVASALDQFIRGEGYGPFLEIYSVPRDAYTHEAGVHLFRREYYIDRARESDKKRGENYAISFRENRILEKYFSSALQHSQHRWTPEIELEVKNNAQQKHEYESAVSKGVITQFSERQVIAFSSIAIIALLFMGVRLNKSARKINRKHQGN